MKKVGLLSVYNHNYGSILQAYALQKKIDQLGYKTEIIRYKKTNYIKQAMRLLYFPLLKVTIKTTWKKVYCRFFHKDVYKQILISREIKFSEFIKNNLIFSPIYCGRRTLIEATEKYCGFILGSDQVWNPMNFGGDFYTMSFVPDDMMKITYAPSFGVEKIPNSQIVKTKKNLARINHISVRESEGVKIVYEMTGRKVPQVVDPTILIDRNIWDTLKGSERIIKEKYILCYFISANKEYRQFAKKVSKKTFLRIVSIPHVDEFVKADVKFGDIVPKGVGPAEFINLISNAEYVCTDSFHGSVFSTLYEIPFFTFSRYSKESKESTNSRLHSFLKLINMEERLYSGVFDIENEDLKTPDFTVAKRNINLLKQESENYLIGALKTIKE